VSRLRFGLVVGTFPVAILADGLRFGRVMLAISNGPTSLAPACGRPAARTASSLRGRRLAGIADRRATDRRMVDPGSPAESASRTAGSPRDIVMGFVDMRRSAAPSRADTNGGGSVVAERGSGEAISAKLPAESSMTSHRGCLRRGAPRFIALSRRSRASDVPSEPDRARRSNEVVEEVVPSVPLVAETCVAKRVSRAGAGHVGGR
jgi:hypothetical protein